jgi:hypothetical protein
MGLSQVGYQVKELFKKVILIHYIGKNINPLFSLSTGPPRAYRIPSYLDFLYIKECLHYFTIPLCPPITNANFFPANINPHPSLLEPRSGYSLFQCWPFMFWESFLFY